MKMLIVAEHSGYCFGVKRAVDAVEKQLESGKTYTLGEIIHNSATVEALKARGAVPINDLSEAEPGAALIIRSHGVGPHIYKEAGRLGLNLIDATCPFVKHIHETIKSRHERGMEIIIAGEKAHPEVIGTNGWCAGGAHIISTPQDAANLPEMETACLVAQTTFSVESFAELVGLVRERVKELEVVETICATTSARQREAAGIAALADVMIVIGGANSSNTQKLAKTCRNAGKPTICIENSVELPIEKITSSDIIGIVAGASTPDWMIREVVTRMNEFEKTAAELAQEDGAVAEAMPVAEEIETPSADAGEAKENTEAPSEPLAAAEVSKDDGKDGEAVDSNIMEAYEKTMVRIRNGQVLQGTIVQITDDEVCVNIGYKSDGFIPKRELSADPDFDPKTALNVGDEITVEVIKVNDGEGNVLLSRKSAEARKLWDELIESVDLEKIYDAVGKEVVKSGVIASINGVRAFIPASQLALKYVETEKMNEFVGQPMRLKIIDVDKSKKRIVASRKAVLLLDQEREKKERWGVLEAGTRIKGSVRRLTDFGAFVDIGGIDGLVHVTDMGWGRVKSPSDIMKIGDEIEVLILSVDPEKERVSLGYKQLQPKPWTKAAEKYAIGSVVEGRVVRIVPFGAFVSLEPTIDGLVHISQVATKRIAKVEDELKVGDVIKAKVLEVIPEAKRISLSRKEVLLEELQELGLEPPQEEQYSPATAENREPRQPREPREPREKKEYREFREPRQPREPREPRVDLPPVQQTTVSLANFFPKLDSLEIEQEAVVEEAEPEAVVEQVEPTAGVDVAPEVEEAPESDEAPAEEEKAE